MPSYFDENSFGIHSGRPKFITPKKYLNKPVADSKGPTQVSPNPIWNRSGVETLERNE